MRRRVEHDEWSGNVHVYCVSSFAFSTRSASCDNASKIPGSIIYTYLVCHFADSVYPSGSSGFRTVDDTVIPHTPHPATFGRGREPRALVTVGILTTIFIQFLRACIQIQFGGSVIAFVFAFVRPRI